jgi:hypothetical protein
VTEGEGDAEALALALVEAEAEALAEALADGLAFALAEAEGELDDAGALLADEVPPGVVVVDVPPLDEPPLCVPVTEPGLIGWAPVAPAGIVGAV